MITLRHALQLFPGETTFYMDNKLYTRKQLVALIKKTDEDNYPDIIINKISIDTTEFYIRFETNDETILQPIIGKAVYRIVFDNEDGWYISDVAVIDVGEKGFYTEDNEYIFFEDIDKTIFLSYEKAETALALYIDNEN